MQDESDFLMRDVIAKLRAPLFRLVFSLFLLQQFLNDRPRFQRWNGAAAVVQEVDVRIDTQQMKHRVVNVGGGDRAVLRDFAQAVCGTDNSAPLDTPTAQQAEH